MDSSYPEKLLRQLYCEKIITKICDSKNFLLDSRQMKPENMPESPPKPKTNKLRLFMVVLLKIQSKLRFT